MAQSDLVQSDVRVSTFVAVPRKMLIGGQWVEAASGKTFPTYNPATGEALADVAEGDKEDIDRAVRAARQAFPAWSSLPPALRSKMLWRLGDLNRGRQADRPSRSW